MGRANERDYRLDQDKEGIMRKDYENNNGEKNKNETYATGQVY